MAMYSLFLHRANSKIDVSKETACYKRYIVISGIVISGLHCSRSEDYTKLPFFEIFLKTRSPDSPLTRAQVQVAKPTHSLS